MSRAIIDRGVLSSPGDSAVIGGGGSNTALTVIGGESINLAHYQSYRAVGLPPFQINPHCQIHGGRKCMMGLGCKQCTVMFSYRTMCTTSSYLIVSKTIDVIVADCKSLIIKNCVRCIFLFCEFDVYQDGVGLLFIGGKRFDLDEKESIDKAKNLYWKLLRTSGGYHKAIDTTNKWANTHLDWINNMRQFLRDKVEPVEPADIPEGDGEI